MRCCRAVAGGAVGALVLMLLVPMATAQAYPRPGTTERVSVPLDGHAANGESRRSVVSGDGRFVAFLSTASNLVPGDTNGAVDVFVRDRVVGTTERVSVASNGIEGNGPSTPSSISADGRYVVFNSSASNLVPNDANELVDVFVRDRSMGTTERVSEASDGTEGNGGTGGGTISPDGRYVAMRSLATNFDNTAAGGFFIHDRVTKQTERLRVDVDGGPNSGDSLRISIDGRYLAFASNRSSLVQDDRNLARDVFVHDRVVGITERVSVASDGAEGDEESDRPAMSSDGRFVAFHSTASNLVPGDTNDSGDAFVHDRHTGVTERVSVASEGTQAVGGESVEPAISADGRFVAFSSRASSLVPGDTNDSADVFVHDRETGLTQRVSVTSAGAQATGGISDEPAISSGGRFVAFRSGAVDLVPGDTNGRQDVFVRDRGPAVGIGGFAVNTASNGVSVSGWATFSHEAVSVVDESDDAQPAGPVAARAGAEIAGAEVTHRAEAEDVLLRVQLASVPGPQLGGAPGVLYRWGFQVDGVEHEVRATRLAPAAAAPSAEPYFALFRCDPTCSEVASLDGGIGTTGSDVRVAVPLQELGIAEAATVTGVVASTSLGEPTAVGPPVDLDEVTVGDLTVSQARVDLGIAPASVPEADVTYAKQAVLAEGRFAGTVNTTGLPAGSYRVWARACLGELCGSRFVEVTL